MATIRDLKNSLGGGIVRLQNWFKSSLRDGLAKPLGDLEIQMWDLAEAIKNAVPNVEIPEDIKEPPSDNTDN